MRKVLGKSKVFVGLSGGVDSSVAALILKNQGYEVTGVFMRCWHANSAPPASSLRQFERAHANECTTEKDAEDARRVAEHLGISFYVWDFEEEYKKRVVEYMIEGYRRGLTPNPDVECNREIKFGMFLERVLRMGGDFVATGHYIKIQNSKFKRQNYKAKSKNVFSLYAAKDKNKDQSYFLWTLTQKQLAHCLFPIGDYLKKDVRKMAERAGLPTAQKKDSQGICFLGQVTLQDFLKDYLPEKVGAVLNSAGEKIGEHRGAQFYTIGQRQGIGEMKHQKGNRTHRPLYVASKDAKTNTVVVAEGGDPNLTRKEIELNEVNFLSGNEELGIRNQGLDAMVRVRYRQALCKAKLCQKLDVRSGRKDGQFRIVFEKPQKFVAAGQSAVFYSQAGEMIGGGIIT